jgi:catechol 2,3-dioxygenase-like lactoylglutathione lyase family enzyme
MTLPLHRQRRLGRAALVILLAFALARAGLAEAPTAVVSVGPIGITVSDAELSAAFFAGVLGFVRTGATEAWGSDVERLQGVFGARIRTVRMRLGSEEIELTEYLAPRGRSVPVDSRGNDLWFQHVAIVVSDLDRAYARLREAGVAHASTGPQRLPDWNPAAGGIEAFYFRDPDGHFLELIEFPPGKGDSRWQGRRELFLGIDHTAVVVSDTEASLRFYRDTLGLRVAGESENWGPEQEHLNGVFGARLRITALRASAGPGIELLEYLAPRDGRPRPEGSRANDLLHWQTDLVVTQPLDALLAPWLARRVELVSPAPANLAAAAGSPGQALLIADPDGHALRVRHDPGDTR